MEHTQSPDAGTGAGEQLAAVTNGIVSLFREYYGRGPNKAKSYILDDRIVICVLEETMTKVEQTLVQNGHGAKVRDVRLTFQEAMADEFKRTVAEAVGRDVIAYHSQLTLEPDIGFEFFVLDQPAESPRSSAAL
jgi:uncharacterized protein YbcI